MISNQPLTPNCPNCLVPELGIIDYDETISNVLRCDNQCLLAMSDEEAFTSLLLTDEGVDDGDLDT